MQTKNSRGNWSSSTGFVLAAAGSAIGLGNLWKFPYKMGSNGGVWFLLAYLLFVFLLGVPIMLTELAIGRAGQSSPVGAFARQDRRATVIGVIGVLAAFVILSYYSVIGGWVLKYFAEYLFRGAPPQFGEFVSARDEPLLWHALFMGASVAVCWRGVKDGIEKASRIMMPLLMILLVIMVVQSLMLPGASGGLHFMFNPESSRFTWKSIPEALGQVFFSLSIGMGAMITYGSYLKRDARLVRNSIVVPTLDTVCSVLAGLAVFPTVFALGGSPAAGPKLIFETLPGVFEALPFLARPLAALFFLLVSLAALTSAISLLECVVSYTVDERRWRRSTSLVVIGLICFVLGVPSSLANGILSDWTPAFFGGRNFLDAMCFLSDNLLMPVGGLLTCIFIGWVQGPRVMGDEITNNGTIPFRHYRVWAFSIRYIAPVLLIIVLLAQFGIW